MPSAPPSSSRCRTACWGVLGRVGDSGGVAERVAFAKYLGVLVPSLGEANVLARVPLGELLPLAIQSHVPHGLLHLELNSVQLVACGVIALLTGVNIRGVREGAFGQRSLWSTPRWTQPRNPKSESPC